MRRKEKMMSGEFLKHSAFFQRGGGRGPWDVDGLFPAQASGNVDFASTDEGAADLLYGLVRALRPRVVLETGTHKGRSTRALAEALYDNYQGRLYTIDCDDYGLMTSGAIPEQCESQVHQIVGRTPEVFETEPLKSLKGIDFAHIDGDHTREGLEADLQYVRDHMDDECWLYVDNARDFQWMEVRNVLDDLDEPHIQLATMCGADLVHFRKVDEVPFIKE